MKIKFLNRISIMHIKIKSTTLIPSIICHVFHNKRLAYVYIDIKENKYEFLNKYYKLACLVRMNYDINRQIIFVFGNCIYDYFEGCACLFCFDNFLKKLCDECGVDLNLQKK